MFSGSDIIHVRTDHIDIDLIVLAPIIISNQLFMVIFLLGLRHSIHRVGVYVIQKRLLVAYHIVFRDKSIVVMRIKLLFLFYLTG